MRKLAILLTAIMTLSIFSTSAFAGDINTASGDTKTERAEGVSQAGSDSLMSSERLEKVIRLVKSKIDIPKEYDVFNSEGFNNGNRMSWRLHWSSKLYYTGNGGSLDITVDEFGNIDSYNHYKYNRTYEYKKQLPTINKNQALDTAKKFIFYISPETADQLAYDIERIDLTIEYDGSYRINFPRIYKNIPFYENNVSVLVNGRTGEVTSLNRNWTYNLIFPDATGVMDVSAAQKAFMDKVGLGLKYKRTYGESPERTYLEYSLDTISIGSGVDAFTGEKVQAAAQYNPQLDPGYRAEMYRREQQAISQQTQLTEKELDEIKRMRGFLSVGTANKMILSTEELGIDAEWEMTRHSYSSNGSNNEYILRLDYVKKPKKEDLPKDIPEEKLKVIMAAGEGGQMANINLNALTGRIISYNTYVRNDGSQKQQRSRDEMKKVADSFLKRVNPGLLAQLELQESSGSSDMEKYRLSVPVGDGTFVYVRKVNSIPFEDNRVIVNVDPGSGKVINYSETWDEIGFISTGGIIGVDKAAAVLFDKIGLELRYVRNTGAVTKDIKTIPQKDMTGAPNTSDIRLIYSTPQDMPVCIDAYTGIVLNYLNAEPYRGKGELTYKDISGYSAKDRIMALADAGILVPDESFRPDDMILQKEFLFMITKFRGGYPLSNIIGEPNQKELDAMYATLVNEGVMNTVEKEPDGKVTREDAARLLLKAAGYKKFAEIEGLFKCDYTDKNEISGGNEGYMEIARAMGILGVENGKILPKKQLTRAEAVTLIYNYMKR